MFKLVVLSYLLALAAASPSATGLYGWAGPLAVPLGAHLAGPIVAPVVAAAPIAAPVVHSAHNYRGPLSLAPGQPASILAADGRPFDTLSVNLDRAAHYTAKAVNHVGAHHLWKRSAPFLAPAAWSHAARIDWPAAAVVAPAHLALSAAPLALPAHIAPWGLAPLGHAAPLGHHW